MILPGRFNFASSLPLPEQVEPPKNTFLLFCLNVWTRRTHFLHFYLLNRLIPFLSSCLGVLSSQDPSFPNGGVELTWGILIFQSSQGSLSSQVLFPWRVNLAVPSHSTYLYWAYSVVLVILPKDVEQAGSLPSAWACWSRSNGLCILMGCVEFAGSIYNPLILPGGGELPGTRLSWNMVIRITLKLSFVSPLYWSGLFNPHYFAVFTDVRR